MNLDCREFRLPNGLRLLVHEDPSSLVVAVNVWYHVGSRNERPGRTGFAHLFEHLMFEGSANVPLGEFDRLLEQAGGINNGSTSPDRTNYWITVPAGGLELALFLESDRMGGLLDALTRERFETQRDVVRNERRESYENRPYGLVDERMLASLYPAEHPYHWPVIGHLEDLDAATFEDAASFFGTWYGPNNASLSIAGNVEAEHVLGLVEKYFGDIPPGDEPPALHVPPVHLETDLHEVLEDSVHLPRAYLGWHSPPAFAEGDAALDVLAHLLASGKASRLHRELVIEQELALDVWAHQASGHSGSMFEAGGTSRAGQPLEPLVDGIRGVLRRVASEGILQAELDNARAAILTSLVDDLQTMGGFGGRADRFNLYAFHTGDPLYVNRDVERFARLSTEDVRIAARDWLERPAVRISVVPAGETRLAGEAA
ncbi:MAG: pitrilysin family protein [Gemmatimonadota bacterium]|jgi:zinc protease